MISPTFFRSRSTLWSSRRPAEPSTKPMHFHSVDESCARRVTTPRMTALRPGASPPPVRMPTFFIAGDPLRNKTGPILPKSGVERNELLKGAPERLEFHAEADGE